MGLLLYLSVETIWLLVAGFMLFLGVLALFVRKLEKFFSLCPPEYQRDFEYPGDFLSSWYPAFREGSRAVLALLGLATLFWTQPVADGIQWMRNHPWSDAVQEIIVAAALLIMSVSFLLPALWHLKKAMYPKRLALLRQRHFLSAFLHLVVVATVIWIFILILGD